METTTTSTVDETTTTTAADALDALEKQARAVDTRVRGFVVQRPLVSLGIALAGGVVVGRLLSR